MKKKMKKEMDEFLDKLYALCWEYHIEIKPTHPVPNDEYPTISIINGDEVVKLLYVDGDGLIKQGPPPPPLDRKIWK